ncbi:MAG: zinc-binding dehydrogenase [Cyanobacteriota bacterium]|nr:zinc-binding dehydrogenase [Cyanobacteriota bacterium]
MSMQAWVLDQPGSPSSLRLAEVPRPQPLPHQVQVNVYAVGLNPVDYKLAATGHPNWAYPFILGLDVAGVISDIGSAVTDWQVGEAVYYHGDLSQPGGFAEYALTTAHTLAPLPGGLSYPAAAAVPCAGWTAYQALYRKLHIQAGQTILVHGGAGGVGGFAVQLAALAGLRVFSTCSTHNHDYVRGLGAAEVIDYRHEDVGARVLDLTDGRGVDAIVDTVSRASATAGLHWLAYGGGIACVADLPDIEQIPPFTKAFSVHEIALGAAHLSGDPLAPLDLARMGREMGSLLTQGKISPMLEQVVDFQGIPTALEHLAHHHPRGKIVAQLVTTTD